MAGPSVFSAAAIRVVLPLILLAGACSSGADDVAEPPRPVNTVRSSGAVLGGSEGGGLQAVRPENPDASGLITDELDTFDESGPNLESLSDEDSELLAAPPAPRRDGIELVFVDGQLGPISPGSTIDEIAAALGPLYIVEEEPFIRAGFDGGYSVSREGEVRFWAIEERGVITMIMSTHPTVGLDSGLRPTMAIDDAVALHGPPVLTIGPESREFVVFADGTGSGEVEDTSEPSGEAEDTAETKSEVVVLVAIGQFGGPVGIYPGAISIGAETSVFLREDATIKELWFPLG